MAKDSRLWTIVIIFLMGGLLFANYSNRIEYVKLKDYRTPSVTSETQVSCDNFLTQKEAQDFFLTSGSDDLHHLDGDNDGKVCESLP